MSSADRTESDRQAYEVSDLFSPDCLQEKRNTQAVEVAANTLVSARIVKHTPAHIKSFDEVKGDIKDQLELEQASALAKKAGEAKLAELKAKKDLEGFGHELTVSRINPQSQSGENRSSMTRFVMY